MTFSPRTKRLSILAAAVLVVAVGGGAAYAYWTTSGSGTGSATTGSGNTFTVTTDPPIGLPLSPGGSSQTVGFTVVNPGPGTQSLTSVVVTVANADGSPWSSVVGCSSADYTVGTALFTAGQIPVLGNIAGTFTVTMNNLNSNQDACQGVTVPLYVFAN